MAGTQCSSTGCEYIIPEGATPGMAEILMSTHALSHRPEAQPAIPTPRIEKVRRPDITAGGTTEDWIYFQSRWGDYIQAARLSGSDLSIQLLECCEESLRRDLTRNAGGTLVDKPEAEILAAIKTLAIRQENTMIARTTLYEMRQDHGEPIRAFGARLRGQASVCKFTKTCSHCGRGVDFSEDNVADVLCRGLSDIDIRQDLLGEQNQDLTVEQTLKFVEAKEAGKRSAQRLSTSHQAEAMGSSYKRSKRQEPITKTGTTTQLNHGDRCSYCGERGHQRRAPHSIRKEKCKAFGVTCTNCGRQDHLTKMCKQETTLQESAISDHYMCAVNTPNK